jgi:glycosyltransferase involved in cell wall biosynthesis
MNRVLMLAYFFPPSKAAGTFRTLRFVRDLTDCGWEPSVLTVDPRTYLTSELDPQLLNKVPPGTPVHRTAAPPLHRWYKRAIESGKKLRRASPAAGERPTSTAQSADGEQKKSDFVTSRPAPSASPSMRSPLDLAYMLCRTPDIDAGWYVPALARGLTIVARERPQVLYATGGPWTTFLVARDLARLTRLPLVLDYRDPWTLNPSVVRTGNLFERVAMRMERTVVRRARWIVANTDVLRTTLMQAHGEELGDKTVIIHNSFDAEDYAGPEPDRESVFTMSYVGAMYDAHSPEPFLQAVAALCSERGDLRGKFRVRLVGAGAPRIAALVRTLGIEDVVLVEEPVSHAEAVRRQRAAHALLLFLTVPSDRSTFVPSKLYEYIAANRPIVAVTRGGALEGLLRRRELTPWIYRPEDRLGIAQGILNLIERHERGCLPALPPSTVHSFSGEAAARALAGVLEAARSGGLPPVVNVPTSDRSEILEEVESR